MQRLTSTGQEIAADLAARHGFGHEAVSHMLLAVHNGWGGMAGFDHPEFGGAGQWMRGGLLMLSDMADHALKARVDALCNEISDRLGAHPGQVVEAGFQGAGTAAYQRQSQGPSQGNEALAAAAGEALPDPAHTGWPAGLGPPDTSGQQNGMRYAYFAAARRLVIQTDDGTSIYDTGDHRITGVSQQQTGGAHTLMFTSQHGPVDLARLPLVSRSAPQPAGGAGERDGQAATTSAGPGRASPDPQTETDVFHAIERLGELKEQGLLTEAEFTAKKTELLKRL